MRRLGIAALDRGPNTSKPDPDHKIYPYLLGDLVVDRANQVWAEDIPCIPMARGFVYLPAAVDWFIRQVLSWRVSIGMELDFCLEAAEEVYLRTYDSVAEARASNGRYLGFLNRKRPLVF